MAHQPYAQGSWRRPRSSQCGGESSVFLGAPERWRPGAFSNGNASISRNKCSNPFASLRNLVSGFLPRDLRLEGRTSRVQRICSHACFLQSLAPRNDASPGPRSEKLSCSVVTSFISGKGVGSMWIGTVLLLGGFTPGGGKFPSRDRSARLPERPTPPTRSLQQRGAQTHTRRCNAAASAFRESPRLPRRQTFPRRRR